jgi:DNA processing protein
MATAARCAEVVVKLEGVVVSGLARGIDTAAHLGAIQAGGRTIAVLGNPLSRFYPAENRELQLELMRDHLVVSQFADSRAGKGGFVARNRTMALLSHATVIVAATENSGTRHQAWEAIRLGRAVFLHRTLFRQGLTWAHKMLEEYNARLFDDPCELEEDPVLNPRAIVDWEREAATASA